MATDPAQGWDGFTISAQPNAAMRGFTRVICDVNGPQRDQANAANARLIAAAPDLLEALGEFYVFMVEDDDRVYLARRGVTLASAPHTSEVGCALLALGNLQQAAIAKAIDQ